MSSTVSADPLFFELGYLRAGPAKCAGVGHFLDDYRTPFDRDEKVIALTDVEQFPSFGRDHDASKIVDLAGDTTVHDANPPWGRSLQRHVREWQAGRWFQ